MGMEIIGDNTTVTSIMPKVKVVFCRGEQHKYWLEFQFVDENNKPVSGLNVRLEYPPLASAKEVAIAQSRGYHYNPTPPPNPPAGVTDAQGLVRFDDLYWITVDVKVDGQQLADEMELRPLGVRRNPNTQPISNNIFKPETRDPAWRSDVQEKAETAGHIHHYVTIGELCDRLPDIKGWTDSEPPKFHFQPGKSLKGTEIAREALGKRHVIEICPFRAWVMGLHNTHDYDLMNGYNLGIMADLVYSAEAENSTIDYFFRQQCQDLSCIPRFSEFPSYFHTLAVDVPFSDRYLPPVYLNTGQGDNPEGDTRLFTVECGGYVLVAWCGTDSLLNALTDASFGPKSCLPELAGAGNVHGGFLEAYELAKRKFGDELDAVKIALDKRKELFICGHSLGGSLALLYAAEMKANQPVLYTYGMPRTFTRAAMPYLDSITHYRHVNDNDTVPQVPIDIDVDNLFYQKLGPLGSRLGFNWLAVSVAGLPVSLWQKDMELQLGIELKKDPYWHHGNTVIFFQAQQGSMKLTGPGQKSLVDGQMYTPHYAHVKLFLVPALNDECLKSTGEHQAAFIQCLNPASLEKVFPKNTNPALDGLVSNPLSHSMAHRYLPYIHNQVLELADPELPMSRKEMRERFKEEVDKGASQNANEDEVKRNREFLALQDMLPIALQRTQSEETGKNSLIRFAAATEEDVEFSR